MGEKTRGYAHRVDIAADARLVWRAITDSACLALWCSPRAQIRAQPRGLFRASVDRVTELEAHIDVFEPNRRLRLIYMPIAGLPATESVVIDDFILEPAEDGTIVRLLGSGYPGDEVWDIPYMRLRMSWGQAMTRLKVFVEKQGDRGTT